MNLSMLPRGQIAHITSVESHHAEDPIAARLRELGFVAGEPVSVLAVAPRLFGRAGTLAVQIGFTRFALRPAEAARIRIALPAA